jgi:hypothetical protein
MGGRLGLPRGRTGSVTGLGSSPKPFSAMLGACVRLAAGASPAVRPRPDGRATPGDSPQRGQNAFFRFRSSM